MKKTSFLIAGKHAVIEALKNPKRSVLRVFLTEESKKNLNRENQDKNLLKNVKIFYKTKRELDRLCSKDEISHQGLIAEIEHQDIFTIIPSILKEAALLIIEPIFLGSVTSSKATKFILFLSEFCDKKSLIVKMS